MKHGDKAKAKTAKAKASGKEASGKKVVAKSSAKGKSGEGKAPKAASKKVAVAEKKASPPAKVDNGKGKAGRVTTNGGVKFTNPLVAEAFRRAVKKYPSAFRRLTD